MNNLEKYTPGAPLHCKQPFAKVAKYWWNFQVTKKTVNRGWNIILKFIFPMKSFYMHDSKWKFGLSKAEGWFVICHLHAKNVSVALKRQLLPILLLEERYERASWIYFFVFCIYLFVYSITVGTQCISLNMYTLKYINLSYKG